MKKPTVTVTGIFKNEEAHLDKCLSSVFDFADEFVLGVDDSSTDRTEEICNKWVRIKGAGKVVKFTWEDDFSKARNFVRDQVTTDWWMTIDGHEYMEPQSVENLCRIWKIVEDEKYENIAAFSFYVQLEEVDGHTRAFQFRLMRNSPEIRYDRPLHNQVVGIYGDNKELVQVNDIEIIHQRSSRNRSERDAQREKMVKNVFKPAVVKNPDDHQAWFYLGAHAHVKGDYKEAERCYLEYLRCSNVHYERAKVRCQLSEVYGFCDRWDERLKILKEGVSECLDMPEMWVHLGETYEHFGDLQHALFCFNSAADLPIPSCFRSDTKLITRSGIKTFAECEPYEVLLTPSGWKKCPIINYGPAPLWKLVVRNSSYRKTIYCTENHRWFVRTRKGRPNLEYETHELLPNHRLQYQLGTFSANGRLQISPVAVIHGFVIGDGGNRRNYPKRDNLLAIFDSDKLETMKPFLSAFPNERYTREYKGEERNYVEYGAIPNFMFEYPSLDETRGYLFSWLAGYFAADGQIKKKGYPVIDSVNREHLEFVKDVCSAIGIGYYSIRYEDRVTPFSGGEVSHLYSLGLMSCTLNEKFFLRSNHRERFRKLRRNHWVVESVQKTDLVEDVYCAYVEGDHAFALEHNVKTGNCGIFMPRPFAGREPNGWIPHLKRASALEQMGRLDEAYQAASVALQKQPLPEDKQQMLQKAMRSWPIKMQQHLTRAVSDDEDNSARIAVFDRLGSFTPEIVQHWRDKGHVVEVRETLDPSLALWATHVWFEWCDENVIGSSRLAWSAKRKVCRLHGYESYTDFPSRLNADLVDYVVFVSDHHCNYTVKQHNIQIPTRVIHNGIDLEKFPFRERELEKPKIAYIGYLHHKKGAPFVIELAKLYPDYEFHIAGKFQGGDLQRYYHHHFDGLDNLVFHGWLEKDKVPELLDSMTHVLSCSITESFGYTILEGMAMGLKPLLNTRPGTDCRYSLWPPECVYSNFDDFKRVVETDYRPSRYREWAERYSLDRQLREIDAVMGL